MTTMWDIAEKSRVYLIGSLIIMNFFIVGYVFHGVVWGFKVLDLSQIIISIAISITICFCIGVPAMLISAAFEEAEKSRGTYDPQDKLGLLLIFSFINFFLITVLIYNAFYMSDTGTLTFSDAVNNIFYLDILSVFLSLAIRLINYLEKSIKEVSEIFSKKSKPSA